MKNRNFISLFFLVSVVGTTIFYTIHYGKRPFARPTIKTDIQKQSIDSIISVAIIGDSWMDNPCIDEPFKTYLSSYARTINYLNLSKGGSTSKDVFQHIQQNLDKLVFFDYCIIHVGTVDAYYNLGSAYYTYHVSLILKQLLACGIKPILVSIPSWSPHEHLKTQTRLRRLQLWINSVLFDNDFPADLSQYNFHLTKMLKEESLIDNILFVDAAKQFPRYKKHKSLYANASHLNEQGSKKMVKELCLILGNSFDKLYN